MNDEHFYLLLLLGILQTHTEHVTELPCNITCLQIIPG